MNIHGDEGIIEELKEYFLNNLHKEEENELLAAVYLQAVNVIKKKKYEKSDKSTGVNKPIKCINRRNYNKGKD